MTARIFTNDIDRATDELEKAHDYIRKAQETLEAVADAAEGRMDDCPTWNQLQSTITLSENHVSEAMEACATVSEEAENIEEYES
jgi:hypothetical protein